MKYLLLIGIFGLMSACTINQPNTHSNQEIKFANQHISPDSLIVFYDKAKKNEILTLLDALNAKVIYEYEIMNGFAIKIDPSQREHIKQTLQKHPSVLGVNDDNIMQLD